MTPKKKAVTGAVCLTAAALLFSGTFAWVSGVQEATNQFVKDDYKVTLHDVLDGTPGDRRRRPPGQLGRRQRSQTRTSGSATTDRMTFWSGSS